MEEYELWQKDVTKCNVPIMAKVHPVSQESCWHGHSCELVPDQPSLLCASLVQLK